MDSKQIDLVNELSLAVTQEELDKLEINLSLDFLTDVAALEIELSRGKVLDWVDWLKNDHQNLENKFSLSVSTKGRPPIVIGAAVYSYDIQHQRVFIHMMEHFKNRAFIDPLKGRMGFVALYVAYIFAKTVKATHLQVMNPLPDAIKFYEHLSFKMIQNGSMESTLESIWGCLEGMQQLGGNHGYVSSDED